MGRKIPGKKHRGVKDPLAQMAKREESLKNKINAPPADPDVQEIPKSVLELNKLRELVKNENFIKKRKKKNKNRNLIGALNLGKLADTDSNERHKHNIRQWMDKSEASLLRKIDSTTIDVIKEISMENKHSYNINKKNNDTNSRKKKDQNPDHKKSEKKVRLKRKKKLKLKKIEKKTETLRDHINYKTDFVKFGEVVHEPPNLKMKYNKLNYDKPGKRSLLLNELIDPTPKIVSRSPTSNMKWIIKTEK